jgi:hypothetical protein
MRRIRNVLPFFLLAFSTAAHAYSLVVEAAQPATNRSIHISTDLCGAEIVAGVEWAIAQWNQHVPQARLFRLDGPLPARADRFISVTCHDSIYFRQVLGKSRNVRGWTYWQFAGRAIGSADIVLNLSNIRPLDCIFLHEVGHALGLGHSSIEGAAMQSDPDCRSLTEDDIAGAQRAVGLP